MKILVSSLYPNPFRDLKRYPVQTEKVETLKQSITDTSFWDNLVLRGNPDGEGYQIAYGHNRLAALRALHIKEIEVVSVREFSDTEMLKIMARENMAEWSNNSSIDQETVRAVVEAYAADKIEIAKPAAKSSHDHLRYAPFFSVGDAPLSTTEHPYTVDSIAKFIGWKPYKVLAALNALALTEEGITNEDTFKKLGTMQAMTVALQVKKVLEKTKTSAMPQGDKKLAGVIAKKLAEGMKETYSEGESKKSLQVVTVHNAKKKTKEWMDGNLKLPKPKIKPDIVKFVSQLVMKLDKMLLMTAMCEKLDAVVKNRQFVPSADREGLVESLRALAKRAEKFAARLEE